jgi:phosphinothricin acetyltransferase
MQIREAMVSDFGEITEIYNQIVRTSTAIYNDRVSTCEERVAWWKTRVEQGFPVLVALEDGAVAGFASMGDFRPWPGYRFTVEGTVHLRPECRGQGIGTQLLNELMARARLLQKHSMIAGVDSENTASLRFLERFGFERVAYLPEVGFKFDRFLDLVLLQFWITPRAVTTAEK